MTQKLDLIFGKPDGTAIDPVCKMTVDTANPPGGSAEHDGQTYYFCGPGCRAAFVKEPALFLGSDDAHMGHMEHDHEAHAGHDHEAHAEHAHDAHSGHDHEAHAEHDHDEHAGHDHEAHAEHAHEEHTGHDHEAHAEHDHDEHEGHEHGAHATAEAVDTAICYPCRHNVDKATAPNWEYKGTTFYFCSTACEEKVKAEPERWLVIANSNIQLGASDHHDHGDEHDYNHGHGH